MTKNKTNKNDFNIQFRNVLKFRDEHLKLPPKILFKAFKKSNTAPFLNKGFLKLRTQVIFGGK